MRATACLFVLNLATATAWAEVKFSLGGGIESFEWKEFAGGSTLLTESGLRYTAGIRLDQAFERGLVYSVQGEVYEGTVDYEGQTLSGIPVLSQTKYDGWRAEGAVGWRQAFDPHRPDDLSRHFAEIRAVIGLDRWDRDIRDSTTVLGTPAYGYVEEYEMVYAKFAVAWHSRAARLEQRLELGIKRPLDVTENVPEFQVELDPKPADTLYVAYQVGSGSRSTIGYRIDVYYEPTRFRASDPEPSTLGLVYQPEIRFSLIGLRAMVVF